MNKPILQCFIALYTLVLSCNNANLSNAQQDQNVLRNGRWRVTMDLPGAQLPFNLEVYKKDSGYTFIVYNDIEEIVVDDVVIDKDSFFISMPVFQSELVGQINSDSNISGNWHNYAKGCNYKIPFHGEFGNSERFISNGSSNNASVDGKWEVTFSEESDDPCRAIGVFRQQGSKVTGTFLTETGDYRFLEGSVIDDSLYLSCFDGSHAFLFKAAISDSGLSGMFWSGKHWKESWIAKRNNDFQLAHPDSLTFIKEGYDQLSFNFPDLDSNMVSLDDSLFHDKVVIVQIMGSWCPNCADEVQFLSGLHKKYNGEGLEMVALCYEKSTKFKRSVKSVKKMKDHFNATYPFLIAGKANKEEAQKTLPMLNHIMSYPTCIFIDRNKHIQKIRTGYIGPGAGEIHQRYIAEIESFTRMLLKRQPI